MSILPDFQLIAITDVEDVAHDTPGDDHSSPIAIRVSSDGFSKMIVSLICPGTSLSLSYCLALTQDSKLPMLVMAT